jgi:hypothetical protein
MWGRFRRSGDQGTGRWVLRFACPMGNGGFLLFSRAGFGSVRSCGSRLCVRIECGSCESVCSCFLVGFVLLFLGVLHGSCFLADGKNVFFLSFLIAVGVGHQELRVIPGGSMNPPLFG